MHHVKCPLKGKQKQEVVMQEVFVPMHKPSYEMDIKYKVTTKDCLTLLAYGLNELNKPNPFIYPMIPTRLFDSNLDVIEHMLVPVGEGLSVDFIDNLFLTTMSAVDKIDLMVIKTAENKCIKKIVTIPLCNIMRALEAYLLLDDCALPFIIETHKPHHLMRLDMEAIRKGDKDVMAAAATVACFFTFPDKVEEVINVWKHGSHCLTK